ncbi:MAG: hypothetical protein M1834_002837 [Cirrosporium novae-zelandiae]|nr:MAG: hypothetical protein M1834_002837 [Cirrosporium novae-zelandiae]
MPSSPPPPPISLFIQSLPKLELHVHIEGTLSPTLRWVCAQRNTIPLPYPTLSDLEASYAVTYNHRRKTRGDNGAPTFFSAYYGGMEVLQTEEDFYDLAMEYFEKAKQMNVRYAEVFFDPQAHTRRGVKLQDVLNGLQKAKHDAEAKLGLFSNWIICFLRDSPLDSALSHYHLIHSTHPDLFKAIGLDSDEYDHPPSEFASLFALARQDGYKLTCHCDVEQKDTHAHIASVLSEIGGSDKQGADRIDHGINAADKLELLDLLLRKGQSFGQTLCPHAYLRHEPADSIFKRIRLLYDKGVKITINSDDPTYMHERWVSENLEIVREGCKFNDGDMIRLQRNAVKICWAEEKTKKAILDELDTFEERWCK